MFWNRKSNCRECGAALQQMEQNRDRVDDLMASSELSPASSIPGLCTSCRIKLTRGVTPMHWGRRRREAPEDEKADYDPPAPAERSVASVTTSDASPEAEQGSRYAEDIYEGDMFSQIGVDDQGSDAGSLTSEDIQRLISAEGVGAKLAVLSEKKFKNAMITGALVAVFLYLGPCSSNSSRTPEDTGPPPPIETSSPDADTSNPEDIPPPENAAPPPPPAQGSSAAANPKPANDRASWVTPDDYPSTALRRNHQGTTMLMVRVTPDGRPDNCEIVESSGYRSLDDASCGAVMRRARFEPGRDAQGNRISGTYLTTVRWQIPN